MAFISQVEPKSIDEAENDPNWITAMQEELNQFKKNDVWILIKRLNNHPVIRTKWVYRNKLDENGTVIQNKAKLVAKE